MQLYLALLMLPVALASPLNPEALSPTSSPLKPRGESGSFSGGAKNFPTISQWKNFQELWDANSGEITGSSGATNAQYIKDAIPTVSQESGGVIDERVILAVIMQESSGNVNVGSTASPGAGVRNPGLMQSHNGVAFDPNDPQGSITQMIRDGTLGTSSGDGLKQCFEHYQSHGDGDKNIYNALRCYNSGSVNLNDLNNGMGATNSYVSDVAHRLVGNPPQR